MKYRGVFVKKIIWHLLIIIYIIVSVFVTFCLLLRNEYNVTQFGDNILIMVDDENISYYNKGDLIVLDINNKYEVNNKVFYYVVREKQYYINVGKLEKENNGLVTIDGELVDKDLVIGPTTDTMIFPFLGGLLTVLESKWGYLCIIIFPVLIAFIYEIYSIIKELKKK